MSNTEKPTLEDDQNRILGILAEDAGKGGLSLEEIQNATVRTGEEWSFRTINAVLCSLGNKVSFAKVRVRQSKVTKYTLRSN